VAMGVKTITLFGPNSNKLWGPYGKGNISIAKYKKGCPFIDNTNRKLIPDILTEKQKTCMDAISVQDVYKRIKR
jgi:ADP-heptose:LPS heptosyltransferase